MVVIIVAEIKVRIQELDSAIAKLKTLQVKCDNEKEKPPTVVGGGKSVNEIEEIGKMYLTLNSHTGTLISNTISFLSNVKTSYQTSDLNIANTIKGK